MKIKNQLIDKQNDPIKVMEQNREELSALMDKVLGVTNKLFNNKKLCKKK